MSLSYDFEKWNMISMALVAISLTIGLVLQYAHGQSNSDFYLEANVNSEGASDMTIVTPALNITKFEIQGKEICPSLQCKIDYKDKYTLFHAPTIESLNIGFMVDFRLQDDITNADLGPIKKEAIEQYSADSIVCQVDDIIEDNGQEIYICHGSLSISNKFDDSRSLSLNTIMMYDAKNETIKVSGNFTE